MTEMSMKELRLHTLRGDIQACGMDGMTKTGVQRLLEDRYVNPDNNIPITIEIFYHILDEEYKKVEAWRTKAAAGKAEPDHGRAAEDIHSQKDKVRSPEDAEDVPF